MLIKHKPTVAAASGPPAGVSVSLELVTKEGASGDEEANGGAEAGK